MKKTRKFLCLSPADRGLLVKAAFLLVAIRLGLWLLPFRTLRRLLSIRTRAPIKSPEADQSSLRRVVWGVKATSRYVPAATCLTQAWAAQVLLCRLGHPTRLRIGVAKSKGGKLEAHAWVESQDEIVIGHLADLSRFTVLPPLAEETS